MRKHTAREFKGTRNPTLPCPERECSPWVSTARLSTFCPVKAPTPLLAIGPLRLLLSVLVTTLLLESY